MVLFLLLLLLPSCLADQVCLTFNSKSITTTLSNTTTVREESVGLVSCSNHGDSCVLDCLDDTFPYYNDSWFSTQSGCLEAQVEKHHNRSAYTIQLNEGSNITCILYMCLNDTILQLMQSLNDSQEGMLKLFYIKDSCWALFNKDLIIKKAFIRREKDMIHEIMNTTTSDHSYDLKDLCLKVINISTDELNMTNARMKVKDAEPLLGTNDSSPEIWLPVDALRQIPQEERGVGLVSYMGHSQFKFGEEDFRSMIVRIELLGNKRLNDLRTSVEIIFRDMDVDNNLQNNSQLQCHYFDENDFEWRKDGCETSINETVLTCSCNHTTAFSVLLIRQEISDVHWEILSYISYIGCGISAFFTALSLVIYVFGRSSRTDHSISIHVSLSGSLFLLNTTFLLSEWGATVEEDWVCMFIAAFMHYCLLCCFTWMAIEALHLYLMLIKVFNTHFKHYLVKLSLAGWGIPCMVVGISLGVKQNQFYGITEMTMVDSNETNAVICKMKQVLRHNLKAEAEAKSSSWMNPNRFSDSCKSGLTVMGITFLMGTTWGLAFLGSGYTNYFILYLFCILNSSQGFFIFLWICLSTQRQRKRDYENRMTSTPIKTSTTKSD
ncbi:adhesion G-protein coupled receptor G5-like isoform X2 [Sphaeramia orbicularis]|uniref:adhesion G-protein coupled receptor G5-like isoform X2 n=1 Tax=Sphaeramia orbicularis TaxID=375764 RepID=UPI00118092EA|nr:adhesion G-protein coupled receptor G5-like isoform X2 [Sphaeramia orbicularis]